MSTVLVIQKPITLGVIVTKQLLVVSLSRQEVGEALKTAMSNHDIAAALVYALERGGISEALATKAITDAASIIVGSPRGGVKLAALNRGPRNAAELTTGITSTNVTGAEVSFTWGKDSIEGK